MIQYERREKLLQYLEQKKSATVRELAALLFTSEASVRRDVEALEAKGFVRKIYGGVILSRYRNGVVPLNLRDSEHSSVKEEIARRAAALIEDGDTVIMDASSTVRRMIKYLNNRQKITVITNNHRLFSEYEGENLKLYCTGGAYSPENHAFAGPAAERYLETVSADILFFSSQGISEEGIISDASEVESSLRRAMLKRAKRRVFLCDSSKLGVTRTFTLCHRSEIDDVICDLPLPWEDGEIE